MARTLEHGNIYFLYRPKVEHEEVGGEGDVQRFYIVLSPQGKRVYRLLVIGRKRLPEINDGGERFWAFVDRIEDSPTKLRDEFEADSYRTKTRGERTVPPVRPAGEGVYALVDHDGHTHLAYALELPKEPNEVQEAFNIAPEASFVVSVKNPEKPSPRRAGLQPRQQADYPKRLMQKFRDRRFIAAEPELLDHQGAELMFIGAREDAERELDIRLDTQDEDADSADIFRDLRLRKSEHPVAPLLGGEWR